jgi:GNAT superfamily N-acetyltransferase
MEISLCTKADFDQILRDVADFWGDKRTLAIHHPMFLYEFGNSAYVMKEGDLVVGYLFGVLSQTETIAYVHLLSVRRSHQRQGIARRLYEHFIDFARENGCEEIKAITSPNNKISVAFHRRMGMELLGEQGEEGIPVMKNYSGPGIHRVIFYKRI